MIPLDDNETNDELQDLSVMDASELRAFLEKRRWFERKLKILEDLAPIYPFIHPDLIEIAGTGVGEPSSSSSFRRHGEESSAYQLPDVAQLEKWQKERDELEEEVLRFDDGDLGRMKEKTRGRPAPNFSPASEQE